MFEVWRHVVIGSALAVYLLGLGCAGGLLLQRMRLDAPVLEPARPSADALSGWRSEAAQASDASASQVAALEVSR